METACNASRKRITTPSFLISRWRKKGEKFLESEEIETASGHHYSLETIHVAV
jgi:hypothetical protein